MSFRSFAVSGKNPTPKSEAVLEKLETFAFAGIEAQEEGTVSGWVGPEHLFDGDFSFPKVFRGRYAVFALRIDTRKVSGPLLQAHTAIAVTAALEAEGLEKLGARRKREIKLEIKRRLLAETPPVQRTYGVFWNVQARRVHLQSTSKGVVEEFRGLFERTFGLDLEPQVPGVQAAHYARERNLLPALREARPLDLAVQGRALAAV